MRPFLQHRGTVAAAVAATAAVLSQHRHSDGSDSTTDRRDADGAAPTMANQSPIAIAIAPWGGRCREPTPRSLLATCVCPRQTSTTAECEAAPDDVSVGARGRTLRTDRRYVRMDPRGVERTSLLESHAVFGALAGEGLIERYEVRQRVDGEGDIGGKGPRELAAVEVGLGSRLDGHVGVVHGGIISLLFDEAMGWGYEVLRIRDAEGVGARGVTAVTASLAVDFRAPLLAGSEAVLRVFHDGTEGRKIFFRATLESEDRNVVFAEARGLFILVKSDHLNGG